MDKRPAGASDQRRYQLGPGPFPWLGGGAEKGPGNEVALKRAPGAPQVGRGLFGVHLLILHFKFQFSKSIKSWTFHILRNLAGTLMK